MAAGGALNFDDFQWQVGCQALNDVIVLPPTEN